MKKNCKHPAYHVVDGQLICVVCGEPSPRAGLVDGRFVRKGVDKVSEEEAEEESRREAEDKVSEEEVEEKVSEEAVEDKLGEPAEIKPVWPAGVKRTNKPVTQTGRRR